MDHDGNTFSAGAIARCSLKLLLKAMHIEVVSIEVTVDHDLGNVNGGQRIDVECVVKTNDTNRAEPQSYVDMVVLPLVRRPHAQDEEPMFHVAETVVRMRIADEDLSVCWGEPWSEDGYKVWFSSSDDGDGFHWTTLVDAEGSGRGSERITFVSGSTTEGMRPDQVGAEAA